MTIKTAMYFYRLAVEHENWLNSPAAAHVGATSPTWGRLLKQAYDEGRKDALDERAGNDKEVGG